MENKTSKTKQVIFNIIFIIMVVAIILSIIPKNKQVPTPNNNININTTSEKLFVEKYIKDNIKTVATNKPVLGGSWYVISVVANPIAHSGEVVYEDGHIQSKANFIYTYNENPQSVIVTKFEILK